MINKWAYIRVGLYSGGGAYIRNDVGDSTCGGLIHGGAYIRGGGLIVGGLRYMNDQMEDLKFSFISFVVQLNNVSTLSL